MKLMYQGKWQNHLHFALSFLYSRLYCEILEIDTLFLSLQTDGDEFHQKVRVYKIYFLRFDWKKFNYIVRSIQEEEDRWRA